MREERNVELIVHHGVFCICIYVYYGSSLDAAKAAATLPGVYYGSPLAVAKAAATLPGVQQN